MGSLNVKHKSNWYTSDSQTIKDIIVDTESTCMLNHCLVAGRIKFKLCSLIHLIHTGRAPQYLVDTVQSVTTSSRRHLRSSETTDYVID